MHGPTNQKLARAVRGAVSGHIRSAVQMLDGAVRLQACKDPNRYQLLSFGSREASVISATDYESAHGTFLWV